MISFKSTELHICGRHILLRDLNLVHCKCLNETDKLVLEQSCGTFFYRGDVFDVRPKEKIRDHAPISLQDLRRVTEKVELQYLKALWHREDGWLQQEK